MHNPSNRRTQLAGGPPQSPSQSVPGKAGTNRSIWACWLWLVWLLPAFLIVVKTVMPGGSERIFLMLFSVVIIPLAGVLGWLPRLILKKRGFRYAPSAVSAVFCVHWVAFALTVLSISGATAQGPIPSPLSVILPFVGDETSRRVGLISAVIVGLSYVALMVLAMVIRRSMERYCAWWTAPVVLAATPVFIIGAGAAMNAASFEGAEDLGGYHEVGVLDLSPDEGPRHV